MGRGPRWTTGDHRRLRELVAQGATDEQIAKAMGRTVQAIESMRYREGITRRRVIVMDDKMMRRIEFAREKGATWAQIAKAAGGYDAGALRKRYLGARRASNYGLQGRETQC